MEQARPVSPRIDLGQIIGAHQPDKPRLGDPFLQGAYRIDRVTSAERGFDIGRQNGRMTRHRFGARQSVRRRRHARIRFQRILRRYQPPDPIQAKLGQSEQSDMTVAFVRRIERPAHQPDPRRPPARR